MQVRARIARYINANSSQDLVFVDNASGGINAVLRSIKLEPSDQILYLNVAYGMVKTTIKYVSGHDHGESMLQANITLPSTREDIIRAVDEQLVRNPAVKLASFSHITSIPAVLLPVELLVQTCRKHGVMVMIDGAHALGQIPVDV